MLKALIVDDEEKARSVLDYYIKNFLPEINTVKQAESVDEALAVLQEYSPDIVFLDVEMPHKNGFNFMLSLEKIPFDVIFTTAYNQYAIQAIRFSALDYLMKPVDPDELKAAVQRHIEKKQTVQQRAELLSNLKSNISKNDTKDFTLAVPSTEGVHFFKTDEILRLEAEGSYCAIHLLNKKPFLASKTLKHFEEMLDETVFIRTHKSHLVNRKHITRISNDHEFVVLSDGSHAGISRRKKEEVMQLLKLR